MKVSARLKMRRFYFLLLWLLLSISLTPFTVDAANQNQTIDSNLIHDLFGPDVARIYRDAEGMPRIPLDSEPLPVIVYKRNESPCNELFVKENPGMSDRCNQSRETITFENRYQKKLTVHILDEKINAIDFSFPIDDTDPLKTRKVILLHGALVVHDIVLKRYSHNHAKIYFFPAATPRVEFDRAHNLVLSFGPDEYIKFMAEDFKNTECRGFIWRPRSRRFRNGTRAVPDIEYRGDQPCMTAVNWSYPPLDGYFDLYNRSNRVGRLPAAILYRKQKCDRAKPLFMETGLLNYLKAVGADTKIKIRYGPDIQKSIEKLLH
jgi:hypothetical protein